MSCLNLQYCQRLRRIAPASESTPAASAASAEGSGTMLGPNTYNWLFAKSEITRPLSIGEYAKD